MRTFAKLLCGVLPMSLMTWQLSAQERPGWVDGFFSERTNSYIEVVSATGYTENEARNKAAQQIVERRSIATGIRSTVHVENGTIVVDGSDNLIVKSRIIDEYCEPLGAGGYRVYLLTQTAKNPRNQYESVVVTDHYKMSPRVLIPGMAQIYKGQTVRGALFIGGELATIGGIVVFENLRTSYASKVGQTHSAKEKQIYIDRADNMQNIRNGFIAGAAAVYAWNVIDGVVAKGKKHVIIGDVAVAPYTSPMSTGLLLSLNF